MLQKILIGGGVLAALIAILIFSGKLPVGGGAQQNAIGDVQLWGVFPSSEMIGIVDAFNAQAKTYRVVYTYVSPETFERTLVEALASGTGPDAILAPYQIILSQQSRIFPFPISSLSEKTFKDGYVDGASVLWSPAGALALPVAVEPMVLFFNRTLFSKHGIVTPPTYWDEVTSIVPSLTIESVQSGFLESGIALGSYTVPYIKDIIMTIVTQLGQVPVLLQYNNDGSVAADVLVNTPLTEGGTVLPLESTLRFMTQFTDPLKATYTWNQFAGNATDLFVAEKLAMYIGYAGELPVLRDRNPKMDIDMTYLPQTRNYNTFVTGMRLYGIAVMRQSKNPTAAFAVESAFAGDTWSTQIAPTVGASPALRGYLASLSSQAVLQKSLLVARGWYDINQQSTGNLVTQMLADIASGRQDVSDAASAFATRMYDVYNRR